MSFGAQARQHADLVLAGALTALMVVEIAVHPAAEPVRAVPAALLAGIGLALRRRIPVVGFVLTAAGLSAVVAFADDLDAESLAFVVMYLVAHYSLGRWTTGRDAWLGVVLVLASMVMFGIGDAASNDTSLSEVSLGAIAFTVGFVGGPWAAGLAIRLRLERESELGAENQRLQAEQEEATRRAVEAERATIARELHDVVSHAISVTVLQSRGARRLLGTDDDAVRRALDAIEHTNTSALSDMRRLLAVLRDTDTFGRDEAAEHAPAPSLEQLPGLLDQVRASGVPVALEVVGEPVDVPPGVDLSAYRIVQEALTNVIKHAGGARAIVRLDYAADALGVVISDDGTQAVNGAGTGHGLIGIRERVSVVGGEVETGPGEHGGFAVRARLPYSLEVS